MKSENTQKMNDTLTHYFTTFRNFMPSQKVNFSYNVYECYRGHSLCNIYAYVYCSLCALLVTI